jgi:peptide/nickel transport system substrate-binding protein
MLQQGLTTMAPSDWLRSRALAMVRRLAPVGLACAVPACAASLTIATASDPQTMDPHSLALKYQTQIAFTIYEPLVGRDQDFHAAPVLATGWSRIDPLTWRFRLRPGVLFHDGSPFTAADAAFSLQRAMSPPSQRQYLLKGIKSVREVDPLTIDLAMSEPDVALPQKLELVAMMSKRWSLAHHVERAQDFNARQETFAVRNANGTGAYRLERYEPDIRTTLKAFPQWWNRKSADTGNVDVVTFATIRSDATRLAALRSGEVDVVLDPPYQDVDSLGRDPALALTKVGEIATDYLTFDQASAALPGVAPGPGGKPRNPFKDVRVRRAVYAAINIDLVIQKVLKGLATPTGDLLPPDAGAPASSVAARPRYDPLHARALLREAGYPDGFDVTMDCVNVTYREHVCQAMAAMLTQVGIRAHLRTSPSHQFFPMVTEGKASLIEFGFTGASEDPWQGLNGLLHTWDGKGGGTFNAGRYSNPALDALIDAIRVERDPARLHALVADALRIAVDDVAYAPLYRHTLSWVMQKKVHVVMLPDDMIPVRWVVVR